MEGPCLSAYWHSIAKSHDRDYLLLPETTTHAEREPLEDQFLQIFLLFDGIFPALFQWRPSHPSPRQDPQRFPGATHTLAQADLFVA